MENTKTLAKATEMKKGETAKTAKAKDSKISIVEKSKTTIDQILQPTAENRVKKLETLNRLAEKKEKIDTKLDELINYRASNDQTDSRMEFSASNGYRFAISNQLTIGAMLNFVEAELFRMQEKTNHEILDFQI